MRLARMAFFQSFGLANAPRRNASSGENVNVKGLSAQSGNWRVVPSARRNGFQFFGAAAGLGLGISFDWLLIVLSQCLVDWRRFSDMSVKPKPGQIFDASKHTPPNDSEILVFHDEIFAWAIGIYDKKTRKYILKWPTPVLYWTLVPPRSLLSLKSASC